jgi:hypothetical protein
VNFRESIFDRFSLAYISETHYRPSISSDFDLVATEVEKRTSFMGFVMYILHPMYQPEKPQPLSHLKQRASFFFLRQWQFYIT